MDTTTERNLDRQSDRQLPDRNRLAQQVLAMHNREHPGSARFCDRECCREAYRTRTP